MQPMNETWLIFSSLCREGAEKDCTWIPQTTYSLRFYCETPRHSVELGSHSRTVGPCFDWSQGQARPSLVGLMASIFFYLSPQQRPHYLLECVASISVLLARIASCLFIPQSFLFICIPMFLTGTLSLSFLSFFLFSIFFSHFASMASAQSLRTYIPKIPDILNTPTLYLLCIDFPLFPLLCFLIISHSLPGMLSYSCYNWTIGYSICE